MLSSTESRTHHPPGSDSKASFLFRMLALLVAASSTSSVRAQDEPLEDLFPGVKFSRHLGDSRADLVLGAHARIESGGKGYIALTYYEPFPKYPALRNVSYALLESVGTEYKLALEYLAADGAGSGLEFPPPFLYTVDAQGLVVYPMCYRGCSYAFFRLGAKPTQVTLQRFDGLRAGESLTGRGDTYRFEKGGLSVTYDVARSGDASCCPTGGSVQVLYRLRGNQFQILGVERSELAQGRQ